MYRRVYRRVGTGLSTAGIDLLGRMLVADPAQRLDAAAALEHPYFDGVRGAARQRRTGPSTAVSGDAALLASSACDVLQRQERDVHIMPGYIQHAQTDISAAMPR